MGRKSLKTERVTQILDAFERCMEQKGLESTTLDNVAKEAGVARRIIRHYVGNRDELIQTAVDRIIDKFSDQVFDVIESSESDNRFDSGLNYIFSSDFNALPINRLVAALLPVSLHDERVQQAVKKIYDAFHTGLDQELANHLPLAPESKRSDVAYSIMCLAFGGGWMGNIGFSVEKNQLNKSIAQGLIINLVTN
ncbi:hypothetical protein A9Q81_13190 [Gammaproteobacteria bacterium 42_54_T18]|nr:hypothetical protein A9Q81_13190 [Gammaproteobacteria bacterium 42_54_T18]